MYLWQTCSCITVFLTLVATIVALATSAWLTLSNGESLGLIQACNNVTCDVVIGSSPGELHVLNVFCFTIDFLI